METFLDQPGLHVSLVWFTPSTVSCSITLVEYVEAHAQQNRTPSFIARGVFMHTNPWPMSVRDTYTYCCARKVIPVTAMRSQPVARASSVALVFPALRVSDEHARKIRHTKAREPENREKSRLETTNTCPSSCWPATSNSTLSVRAFYQSANTVPSCIHSVLSLTRSTKHCHAARRVFS